MIGWPANHQRPGAIVILRSLVLGAAVFVVAALAGVLLSGAAPASTDRRPPAATADRDLGGREAADERALEDDTRFAQSMVYSGTAALAVSVVGLVIVARRRRLW